MSKLKDKIRDLLTDLDVPIINTEGYTKHEIIVTDAMINFCDDKKIQFISHFKPKLDLIFLPNMF